MADLGLLAGLAEGIKQGLGAYQDQKRYIEDQALKKRQLALQEQTAQAGLYDKGLEVGAEGKLQPMQATQFEKDLAAKTYARALPGEQLPTEELTRRDISEGGLLKTAITGGFGAQGRELSNQRMLQNIELQKEKIALGKQRIANAESHSASDAGKQFDTDTILKTSTNTSNSLDRALSMLTGKATLTAKNMAIAQQDMINAMAPGGAATEGKVNREMVHDAQMRLNEFLQNLGKPTDLRKTDPKAVEQLIEVIKQVQEDFAKAKKDRAAELASSYKYNQIKGVKETVKNKAKRAGVELDENLEAKEGGGLLHDGLLPKAAPGVTPTPMATPDPTKMTREEKIRYLQQQGLK